MIINENKKKLIYMYVYVEGNIEKTLNNMKIF